LGAGASGADASGDADLRDGGLRDAGLRAVTLRDDGLVCRALLATVSDIFKLLAVATRPLMY